ncbi:hypothetical protein [Pedobacter steynii]
MKILILIFLFIVFSIISCTKEEKPLEPIVYVIDVKVNDGVEYFTQVMTELQTTRNQKPNASVIFKSFNKIGTIGHVTITTIPQFKDEIFDVKVTKESTEEVIASDAKKGGLVLTWEVK